MQMIRTMLHEAANERKLITHIASVINKETNNKYQATLSHRTGTSDNVLSLTTPTKSIPSEVNNIFKSYKIGNGEKQTSKQKDGTFNIKFMIVEV